VTNEAFARVKIDQLLRNAEWKVTDGRSVRFEYPLDDGGKADYALFNRQGRALGSFCRYGKGRERPAWLNLGDCFAYAVAKKARRALLFKGKDFDKTDIQPAMRLG
jgi:predicted type IV restriction endonuclease